MIRVMMEPDASINVYRINGPCTWQGFGFGDVSRMHTVLSWPFYLHRSVRFEGVLQTNCMEVKKEMFQYHLGKK